jgi:hypothetical protein
MKKITFFAFCGLFSFALLAQERTNNWCYTDQNSERLRQENPMLIQQNQELEELTKLYSETSNSLAKKNTIIIPVVVHNITHSGGMGYVSKATIDAQIERLNIDFNRLNSDTSNTRALFKPHASSIDIEFRLAHLDPNGECTEGIVRKESPLSFNGGDAVKAVSYWDSKKYFNIWVVDAINQNPDGSYVAGYAQFPGDGINNTYGVVCVNQNFSGYDRTLTHEIGHCFNLLHTFNYGYCGGSGDNCSDTPPVIESFFDCDPNRNTCSNDGTYYGGDVVDQFENYMSYASCQNMFTIQQVSRMMTVLNNTSTNYGLQQLWDTGNLATTGVSDPYNPNPICIPLDPDFTYTKQYLCEGDQVSFADLGTYNATPTAWDWTFTGGTPSTSTQASPTITYNSQGVYDVSYSPGTTAGWATPKVKSNLITVSSLTADYLIPFVEGFENTTTLANEWAIKTQSGQGWQSTTSASYTGARSLMVNNYLNSPGDITEVISPSYDLTTMASPKITYDWAFAKKVTGGNDQFIIYYSTDCGGSWTIKAVKAGTSMTTSSATNSSFVPSSIADWNSAVVDLSSLANETNVKFKFYFKNNGGNNFYLDNLNINGLVGVKETKQVNNLKVYPNPMNESASISFNLQNNVSSLTILVRDVLGKEVTRIVNNSKFSAGKYTLSIDKEKLLSSGLYFIEFNADNNVQIEKLIVK